MKTRPPLRFTALLGSIALAILPQARADDYRWDGGGGDYNTPNWFDVTTQQDHSGPPLAIDGAFIPDNSVVTCDGNTLDRFFTSPTSGVLDLSGIFNVNKLGSLNLVGGGGLNAAVIQAVTVGGVADAGASVSVTGSRLAVGNVISVPTLAVGDGSAAMFTVNGLAAFNTVHVYGGSSLSLPGAALLWAGGKIEGGSALVAKSFGPANNSAGSSSGDMVVDGAGTTATINGCRIVGGNLSVTNGAAMNLQDLSLSNGGTAEASRGSTALVSGPGSQIVASDRVDVPNGDYNPAFDLMLTVDRGGLLQGDTVSTHGSSTHSGIVVSNGSTLRVNTLNLYYVDSYLPALFMSEGSQAFVQYANIDSLALDGVGTSMIATAGTIIAEGQSRGGNVTLTNSASLRIGTEDTLVGASGLIVGYRYPATLDIGNGASVNVIGVNVPASIYVNGSSIHVENGGFFTTEGNFTSSYEDTFNVEGYVNTAGNLRMFGGDLNVSGAGAFTAGRGFGSVLSIGIPDYYFNTYRAANVSVTAGASANLDGVATLGSDGNINVSGGGTLQILTGVIGAKGNTGNNPALATDGVLNVYNAGSSATVSRTLAVGGTMGSATAAKGSLGVNDGATVAVNRELSVSPIGQVSVAAVPLPSGTTPSVGGRIFVGTDTTGAAGAIRVGKEGLLTGRAMKPDVSGLAINVVGNVIVGDGGEFRPGAGGADSFTIQGDCDLSDGGSAGGETKFGLHGTGTPGADYDQLIVSGTATLGGKLTLVPLPGYAPQVGDAFQLAQAKTIVGGFTRVNAPGLTVDTTVNANRLIVTVTGVTPLPAPTITSATAADGTVGEAFTYQIATDGTPGGYAATGLPDGLDVDPSGGAISGVPTVSGTFPVTLTATNTGGTGTATLTLTIAPPPDYLAQITSPLTASGVVNEDVTYQITATSQPKYFSALGLPAGLRLEPFSGYLYGKTTQVGTFLVTLQAVNDYGTAEATLALTIGTTVFTPPTVTAVVANDGLAVEGVRNGKVFIQRTGDTSAPLTVLYKTKGSAKAGTDFKPLPGTVTIPAGASKAKVKIKPIDNDTHDGTRKAKVQVLPASDGSYTVGDPSVAKVKIIDND